MGTGNKDSLSQAGIVSAHRVSGGRDRAEVVDTFDLRCLRVQRVGKPLEALGGLLDCPRSGAASGATWARRFALAPARPRRSQQQNPTSGLPLPAPAQ